MSSATEEMAAAARGVIQLLRGRHGATMNDCYEHCRSRGDDVRKWPQWALDYTGYVTEEAAAMLVYELMEAHRSPQSETATTLPDIEVVSNKVHQAWLLAKQQNGVTSRKAEDGEELMVSYRRLSEKAKELDRATVRAVYAAINATSPPSATTAISAVVENLRQLVRERETRDLGPHEYARNNPADMVSLFKNRTRMWHLSDEHATLLMELELRLHQPMRGPNEHCQG